MLGDERVDPAAGGNYAIEFAAGNGHTEVVQRLLEDKRVNICNKVIIKAAKNGHGEIVELLLKDKRANAQYFFDYVLKQVPEKLRVELKKDLEQHIKDIGWC